MKHIELFEGFLSNKFSKIKNILNKERSITSESKRKLDKYHIKYKLTDDLIKFEHDGKPLAELTFDENQPDSVNTFMTLKILSESPIQKRFLNSTNAINYLVDKYFALNGGRKYNDKLKFK